MIDSDYAARVLEFVKDKSLEELNLFHWKRNFDLYMIIHSSYHYWTNRSIQVKVIKSHCLDESRNLRDRYEHLGNEFADLAAKTIAKNQGIVEFFQTRSSLWTYVEKAETDWKAFYEFCYGVAQTFLNAEETDTQPQQLPTLITTDDPESQPQSVHNRSNVGDQEQGLGQPYADMELYSLDLTNLELFDLGDPFHRRRQMSSYGATYNRCLLAFWRPSIGNNVGQALMVLLFWNSICVFSPNSVLLGVLNAF